MYRGEYCAFIVMNILSGVYTLAESLSSVPFRSRGRVV